ncbi:hypothetical protein LER27_13950 [Pseudomonas aeruginosa]|uniref:hypothetical protein n=1 Tax=Pseudomonas aeruginosa TaxID=287 RepID=UPI001A292885|nr:hypothetical protein [Pseudomonas aeruginosa]MBI7354295.1 hypothetical protein [Pseudomonas aeruginosa]MBI8948682.1 hypothetical protein [Pseudomonas aeruginosa]MDU0538062.1 hypothetical protein [Pseudomonas aeruginosa]HEJ4043540.1 hypothetical protein [Pseudomonas aeruginosa]HEJ5767217.1 hypothetical protein [Pseudomonas aeruginosa]
MKSIVIALFAIVALAGCSDENSKVRGEFMAGCIKGGAGKSVCACTFEKLEKAYSPEQLKALNTPYKAPPKIFIKDTLRFAMACRT